MKAEIFIRLFVLVSCTCQKTWISTQLNCELSECKDFK